MKALIVGDPLDGLKPQSDSSLALAGEMQRRGWKVFWTSPRELSWWMGQLRCETHLLKTFKKGEIPQVAEWELQSLQAFDRIWVRKDPPFDSTYLQMCWFLAAFEKQCWILNAPSQLLRFHEKMIQEEAVLRSYLDQDDIFKTCITSEVHTAFQFLQEQQLEKVIIKPWLGYGGRDIHCLERSLFAEEIPRIFKTGGTWMVQAYEPKIEEGDRRVFFINGVDQGDFVRIPQGGAWVSNLSRGGTASLKSRTEKEQSIIKKLETYLKDLGVFFAGADLIDARVTEVNITSPTGLVQYEQLTGGSLAERLVDAISETNVRD